MDACGHYIQGSLPGGLAFWLEAGQPSPKLHMERSAAGGQWPFRPAELLREGPVRDPCSCAKECSHHQVPAEPYTWRCVPAGQLGQYPSSQAGEGFRARRSSYPGSASPSGEFELTTSRRHVTLVQGAVEGICGLCTAEVQRGPEPGSEGGTSFVQCMAQEFGEGGAFQVTRSESVDFSARRFEDFNPGYDWRKVEKWHRLPEGQKPATDELLLISASK